VYLDDGLIVGRTFAETEKIASEIKADLIPVDLSPKSKNVHGCPVKKWNGSAWI
jgi:hypothetical protein